MNKNIKINIIDVSKKLMNLLETNINLDVCEGITDKHFEKNFFNEGVSTLLDQKNNKFLLIDKKKEKCCKVNSQYFDFRIFIRKTKNRPRHSR